MALVNWEDSLSIGISEIDMQHKKLVDLINKLNDAMKSGKSKDVMGTIFNELINYTATHFKTEEKYFDQYKYESSEAHKIEHAKLVKEVQNLKRDFESGKMGMSMDIMNFLVNWLKNHILISDRKYVQCFKNNGLK